MVAKLRSCYLSRRVDVFVILSVTSERVTVLCIFAHYISFLLIRISVFMSVAVLHIHCLHI